MVAPGTASGIPTTEEAVAASVACARQLGLPTDRPEIIAEGYSLRVRLEPAPVVTRVLTVGQVLRGEPLPWLQREVAIAGFLAAAVAPVVPPWDQPGPYVVNGLAVSLWRWVEHERGTIAPAAFGAQVTRPAPRIILVRGATAAARRTADRCRFRADALHGLGCARRRPR